MGHGARRGGLLGSSFLFVNVAVAELPPLAFALILLGAAIVKGRLRLFARHPA